MPRVPTDELTQTKRDALNHEFSEFRAYIRGDGDAAHGMLPFAGQGAAQVIEDALALAHAIDSHEDTETAFEAYEAERKPRAERILRSHIDSADSERCSRV